VNKKLFLVGFLLIILSGCTVVGMSVTDVPEDIPTPQLIPTMPTATLMPEAETSLEIRSQWGQSPHAQATNEVACDMCHETKGGVVTSDIAFWNEFAREYEHVDDDSDLCRNCHEDYDHSETIHKEFSCLDCHDSHSTFASCLDCHTQVVESSLQVPATPIDGHNTGMDSLCNGSGCHSVATQVARMPFSIHGAQHSKISCEACHDADGLQVGPLAGEDVWTSWYSSGSGEEPTLVPFSSHNLQLEVDCLRCHYDDNPWGLGGMGSNQSSN